MTQRLAWAFALTVIVVVGFQNCSGLKSGSVASSSSVTSTPSPTPAAALAITNFTALPSSTPTDAGYDILVVAGQSNAQGSGLRGFVDPDDTPAVNARLFQVSRYDSEGVDLIPPKQISDSAVGPCHDVSPVPVDRPLAVIPAAEPLQHFQNYGSTRVGFAMRFARLYAQHLPANRKVLIVPAAKGSSSILEWSQLANTNGNLCLQMYSDLFMRTDFALNQPGDNRIVALLWLQGENDIELLAVQTQPLLHMASQYSSLLQTLIAKFRARYAQVPVLVGEVAQSFNVDSRYGLDLTTAHSSWRSAVNQLQAQIPLFRLVSSAGLSTNVDALFQDDGVLADAGVSLHFDAESQMQLGENYWAALQALHSGLQVPVIAGLEFPEVNQNGLSAKVSLAGTQAHFQITNSGTVTQTITYVLNATDRLLGRQARTQDAAGNVAASSWISAEGQSATLMVPAHSSLTADADIIPQANAFSCFSRTFVYLGVNYEARCGCATSADQDFYAKSESLVQNVFATPTARVAQQTCFHRAY